MIEVHGGQLKISGSHYLLRAELAYVIAEVREYLKKEESEPYAISTISVSRIRADNKRLEELKKDAEEAEANEY